jgi:carboxylesterase type B
MRPFTGGTCCGVYSLVVGFVSSAQPLALWLKGDFNKVPMIMGTVSEEARMFVWSGFPGTISKLEYDAVLDVIFPKVAKEVRMEYPPSLHTKDCREETSVLATDYIMACSTRAAATGLHDHDSPVYIYEFDHAWSMRGAWGPNYTECEGHVCHGAELPFVFNTATYCDYALDDDEKKLADQMGVYWTNFAKYHNPNGPSEKSLKGLPVWPQFDNTTDKLVYMTAENITIKDHVRSEYCNFWDGLGYNY